MGIISPHFDWLSDGVLVSVRGYSGHSSSSGLSNQSRFPHVSLQEKYVHLCRLRLGIG